VSKEANHAVTVTVGSENLEICANSESIDHAAAEIGKSMPESFTGEHSTRVKALVGGDPLEAKFEAFHLLAYQVSNNLIEDVEDDLDAFGDNYNKFVKIVDMFKDVGLPPDLWAKIISAEQNRTSAAFAEALFEAAVNCMDLGIVETLLESGVDPNQPIWAHMTGNVERPLQLAADLRFRNLEMARLLVRAGADIDAVTEEDERPALHITAEWGTLEMTKLLVENGANLRRWVPSRYNNEPVRNFTALVGAANSSRYEDHRFNDSDSESVDGDEVAETKERESLRVFRYLLSLHKNSQDHCIFQDALVIAAHHGRTDMIELLHAAGADVNEKNSSGFTALEAAAWQNYRTLPASSMLVRLGANPNRGHRVSALHMAAANKDADLVQLLVDNGADSDASITLLPYRDADTLGPHFQGAQRQPRIREAMAHLHTPLHLALYRNRDALGWGTKTEKGAMILLQAGAKLSGGELVQAVDFDSEVLVQTLLDRGADVNEESWSGSTALQACLRAGHGSLAGILLRAGARLKGGELFSAFKAGQRELIDILLANGASLQDTGPNGESILEAACSSQRWQQMLWAIQHVPSPYDSGALCAAVCSSVEEKDVVYLRRLFRQRRFGKVDRLLEATAVGHAAYRGNWPVLECLLRLQNLNICIVPLSEYYGYQDLVLNRRWNLEEGYTKPFWHDFTTIRCSALVPAILGGDWEIVRALLKARYRPDALSLLAAIKGRTPAEITELIAHGAEVNTPARHDLDTPLQLAVRFKRVDLVQTLLNHGADVNAPPAVLVPTHDRWGYEPNELAPRSALQAAVEHSHLQLIDLLLAAGANINGPWSQDAGATAVQLAAAKGHLGIARRLLELGAEIDARRAELRGRTALEGAAEQGRLDMVQFLLENGAKTKGDGVWQYHRAIGFARRNGHRTVARLLEDWREWERGDYDWSRFPGLLDDKFREPEDIWWKFGEEYGDEYSEDEDGDEDVDNDEY
jgi:ankyrin repeat protein